MRAVELFCGAGGMSRGLIDAGIDVVRAYDAWPVAVENYRKNVGPHAEVADLKNLIAVIPEISRLAPDLVCGGPPCQDYSLAGKREEGENASLTVAFAIVVTTVRPEWFLMENVLQAEKSSAWTEARAMLKRAGYGISESKLTASFYGVPQSRRRFFAIGRLGERDGFLQSDIASAASSEPMTLRALFSPNTPADAALLSNGFVYARPVRGSRGVRTIDEPFPTVTRTSWERPGPKYIASPHPNDPVPATSTAELTREQASRIQGFPAQWRWVAPTQRDILQMIANAVPAPVARALGEIIVARQMGLTAPAIEGRFLDWLVRAGRNRSSARNVKSNVNRARRLLGGRTYADVEMEISALDAVPGFNDMKKGPRSDLRQALRLHAEFMSMRTIPKQKRKPENTPIVALIEEAEAPLAA